MKTIAKFVLEDIENRKWYYNLKQDEKRNYLKNLGIADIEDHLQFIDYIKDRFFWSRVEE